jgi:hypothetical protein
MNENNLNPQESAGAKSTDKSVEEAEIVRKPPVLDAITTDDSDESRDPTVQDRPLSEDLIKAALAQQAVEEKQARRKLIVPSDIVE